MITNGGGPINTSDIGDLAFVKPTPGGGRTYTSLNETNPIPEPTTVLIFSMIMGGFGALKKFF